MFDAAADASELTDRLTVSQFSVRFDYLAAQTRQIGFEIGIWPLNAGLSVSHSVRREQASWVQMEIACIPAVPDGQS